MLCFRLLFLGACLGHRRVGLLTLDRNVDQTPAEGLEIVDRGLPLLVRHIRWRFIAHAGGDRPSSLDLRAGRHPGGLGRT
jgi:hypothetical protein